MSRTDRAAPRDRRTVTGSADSSSHSGCAGLTPGHGRNGRGWQARPRGGAGFSAQASRIAAMTTHAISKPPAPFNEPVRSYAPGTPERASLKARVEQMRRERIEVPCVIGGQDVRTGKIREAVMPHDKDHVLADVHHASGAEVQQAIDAAAKAWEEWSLWP